MKRLLSVTVALLSAVLLSACGSGGGGGGGAAGLPSASSQQTSVKLPRTGQVVSYATGSVGDNGALQTGIAWPNPRFADNADATVTDNLTGLMWLKDANCINTQYSSFDNDGTAGDGRVTWQHALDFVVGINDGTYSNCSGGHTGWRLPNKKELRSLVDYSQYDPALPAGHPFSNVQASYYSWSSTTYAGGTAFAWIVGADVRANPKTGFIHVWPVRDAGITATISLPKSGQTTCYDAAGAVISCATATGYGQDGALQKGVAWPSTRFSVASSGTGTIVTDNLTSLIWAGDAGTPTFDLCTGGTTTWQGALDYVACLNTKNYLGHADWRLPNVNELESLDHVEYTRETTCGGSCATNAAWLNSQGFSNVQAGYYWSSTTYANFTTNAWIVGGGVYASSKASSDYVWPVRSDLFSITITPANPAAGYGVTQQFKATGTYKDGSTQDITGQAIWSSSNTAIATIDGSGLATTKTTTGSTTIKATYGGMEATTTLTVTS